MDDICNNLGGLDINSKKIWRRKKKAPYKSLINPFTKRPVLTSVSNCRKLTKRLHYIDIPLAWRTMIKWHIMDGYKFQYSVREVNEIPIGYEFLPARSAAKGVDIWIGGGFGSGTSYFVEGDDEARVDAWIAEMYAEYHPGGYGTTMTKNHVDGRWYVRGYVGGLGT